jgi:DNA oxidative demethylase
MDFVLRPGFLSRAEQEFLLSEVRAVIRASPLFTPTMPRSGKPFSVQMTNCGSLGWVSDASGYRYQSFHPETGAPWPPMPKLLLKAWQTLSGYRLPPEACLINVYSVSAKMGLHQDRDEDDLEAPVVSLSLGDTGIFRIGGHHRNDPTRTVRLASGDAIVLGGQARLAFHGVDRILPNTSTLLQDGGRINLTMRRVNRSN